MRFIFIILFLLLHLSCQRPTDAPTDTELQASERMETVLADSMNDFEKAVSLRRLVADTIDEGNEKDSLCENFASISFKDFKIEPFTKRFHKNTGTAKCGLAGSMLTKLLNNHGIEAYTYNFGFNENLAHIVVIARTSSNEWTVHDPYYNYSLVDSLGQPKDFFQLITELDDGYDKNVKPTNDTVWREVIVDYNKIEQKLNQYSQDCFDEFMSTIRFNEDSTVVYRPICYNCRFDKECRMFTKRLHENLVAQNLPPKIIFGYLLQINTVWGPHPKRFQSKLDSFFASMDKLRTI